MAHDGDRSITASTTTSGSITTFNFPLLNCDELGLLSEIVHRVPEGATTHAQLVAAYHEVFDERGLDVESDQRYYSLLLKLGMVRGRNWKERWQNVLVNQGCEEGIATKPEYGVSSGRNRSPSSVLGLGGLDILKAKIDQLEHEGAGLQKSKSTPSLRLHAHSRSGELGAISSRGGSKNHGGLIGEQGRPKSAGGQATRWVHKSPAPPSAGDDKVRQRDPRQRFVHPSPSFREVDSTPQPLIERTRGVDRGQTGIRRAPMGRDPVRNVSRVQFKDGEPQVRVETQSAIDDPEENERSAWMITQADKFSRIVLLDQCANLMQCWKWKTSKIKETWTGAANAETNILLRRNFTAWRATLVNRLRQKLAAQYLRNSLLRNFFGRWRRHLSTGREFLLEAEREVGKRARRRLLPVAFAKWRQARLKLDIQYRQATRISEVLSHRSTFEAWRRRILEQRADWRKKGRVVRKAWNTRLRKDAFAVWRVQAMHAQQADRNRRLSLLKSGIVRWTGRLRGLDGMKGKAEELDRRREVRIACNLWDDWKRNAWERRQGRMAGLRDNRKLLRATFSQWKLRTREAKGAQEYRDLKLFQTGLLSWRIRLARVRRLEQIGALAESRRLLNLQKRTLLIWQAEERYELLKRVRETRLARSALHSWALSTKENEDSRRGKEITMSSQVSIRCLRESFATWTNTHRNHKEAAAYADGMHSLSIGKVAIRAWRQSLGTRLVQERKGDLVEKFFLLRKSWKGWKVRLDKRLQDKWIEGKKMNVLRKSFGNWRFRAQRTKGLRILQEEFRAAIDQRIANDALQAWIRRVVDVHLREMTVAQEREQKLLRSSVHIWLKACYKHGDDLGRMESFREIKDSEWLRRLFSHWRYRTLERVSLDNRLVKFNELRKKAVLRKSWDHLRERFVESRIERMGLEDVVRIGGDNRLLRKAFGQWLRKTKTVPAIQFRSRSLLVNSLATWKQRLPAQRMLNEAGAFERRNLLFAAFSKWSDAAEEKLAKARGRQKGRFKSLPPLNRTPLPPLPSTSRQSARPSMPTVTPHASFSYRSTLPISNPSSSFVAAENSMMTAMTTLPPYTSASTILTSTPRKNRPFIPPLTTPSDSPSRGGSGGAIRQNENASSSSFVRDGMSSSRSEPSLRKLVLDQQGRKGETRPTIGTREAGSDSGASPAVPKLRPSLTVAMAFGSGSRSRTESTPRPLSKELGRVGVAKDPGRTVPARSSRPARDTDFETETELEGGSHLRGHGSVRVQSLVQSNHRMPGMRVGVCRGEREGDSGVGKGGGGGSGSSTGEEILRDLKDRLKAAGVGGKPADPPRRRG